MKKIVFTFGRLNPISKGHELLASTIVKIAKRDSATPRIYLSHTKDPKKNPLDYRKKILYAQAAFGSNVVKASGVHNLIGCFQDMEKDGFTDAVMVVGSDRVPEFAALVKKYNGKEFKFASIRVISAGERDPDADDVTGMSASKMRSFVAAGDKRSFIAGAPLKLSNKQKLAMFNDVAAGMNLREDCYIEEESIMGKTFTDLLSEARKSDHGGTDGEDAGDSNIIYQMRKVIALRGRHPVKHANGDVHHMEPAHAAHIIKKYTEIGRPIDKQKFTKKIGKSKEALEKELYSTRKTMKPFSEDLDEGTVRTGSRPVSSHDGNTFIGRVWHNKKNGWNAEHRFTGYHGVHHKDQASAISALRDVHDHHTNLLKVIRKEDVENVNETANYEVLHKVGPKSYNLHSTHSDYNKAVGAASALKTKNPKHEYRVRHTASGKTVWHGNVKETVSSEDTTRFLDEGMGHSLQKLTNLDKKAKDHHVQMKIHNDEASSHASVPKQEFHAEKAQMHMVYRNIYLRQYRQHHPEGKLPKWAHTTSRASAVVKESYEDGLVKKSLETGIPYSVLEDVYLRGLGEGTCTRIGEGIMNAHQKAFARVNAFIAGSSPEDDDLREGLTNPGKPVTQKKPLDVWAKRRERWKGHTKPRQSEGDKKWAAHMKGVKKTNEDELLERPEFGHHRVRVRVSHPNHPVSSKRKVQHVRHATVLAHTPEEATKKVLIHYRKHGYKTHEIEHIKEDISEAYKMTYEKGSWEPGHHHILHTQLHSPDLETAKTGEAIGHSVRQHPHHQALVKAGWRPHTYGAHKKGAFSHTIHTAEEVTEIQESPLAGVLKAIGDTEDKRAFHYTSPKYRVGDTVHTGLKTGKITKLSKTHVHFTDDDGKKWKAPHHMARNLAGRKIHEGENPFAKKDGGAEEPPKKSSANTANTAGDKPKDKQVKDDKNPTIKVGTKEKIDMQPTLRESSWKVVGGNLVREGFKSYLGYSAQDTAKATSAPENASNASVPGHAQSTVATPPDRHIYTDDRSWHMATGDHHLNQAAHHHGKANDPKNNSAFSRARHSEKHDTHIAASRHHYRMAGLMREEVEALFLEAKDDYQGDPTKPFGPRGVHMDANSALKHHGWSKMAGSNKAWVRGSNSDRMTHLGNGKYRHNYSAAYSYHGGNKEQEVHDTGKGEMFAYLKKYHAKS